MLRGVILGHYSIKNEALAAFNHSEPLHNMRFKDIRPNHTEGVIEKANVGNATKSRIKSMYNLLYRYIVKYNIVEKTKKS